MRSAVVRAVTLLLAFVHLFPARKHVALFVAAPSIDEAWKGFGACAAVALYLLPPHVQARLLAAVMRRAPLFLSAATLLLAAAHVVAAVDHLPRIAHSPSWADAWRGIGATIAAAWLALPFRLQACSVRLLRHDAARFFRTNLGRAVFDPTTRAPRQSCAKRPLRKAASRS